MNDVLLLAINVEYVLRSLWGAIFPPTSKGIKYCSCLLPPLYCTGSQIFEVLYYLQSRYYSYLIMSAYCSVLCLLFDVSALDSSAHKHLKHWAHNSDHQFSLNAVFPSLHLISKENSLVFEGIFSFPLSCSVIYLKKKKKNYFSWTIKAIFLSHFMNKTLEKTFFSDMPIKMWSAFCWKCFNEVFCLQKSYYSNVVNDIVDVNLVLKHLWIPICHWVQFLKPGQLYLKEEFSSYKLNQPPLSLSIQHVLCSSQFWHSG